MNAEEKREEIELGMFNMEVNWNKRKSQSREREIERKRDNLSKSKK